MLVRLSLLFLALASPASVFLFHENVAATGAGESKVGGVRSSFLPELQRYRYLGPATCASMNCHNGPGLRGGEYAAWLTSDKHARAYQTLGGAKSRQIIKNFFGAGTDHQAEREGLCLQCHSLPNADTTNLRSIISEGVSCEACHGPAEHWLGHHHKTSWRPLSAEQKRRFGMRDTGSISERAESCVACHVGAPGMEVNHDLIAAGHPQLKFEFAAYHALMPHHWNDRGDKDPALGGRSDFEARAWVIGQVVCARAALELLAHRAADEAAPWPEFAEYDCYACHQQLQPHLPGMTRAAGTGGERGKRRPGGLAPTRWYQAELTALTPIVQSEDAKTWSLESLETELSRPFPDRAKTALLANRGAERGALLHESLRRRDAAGRWGVTELFASFAGAAPESSRWEVSAQRYLSLAALHNAWKDTAPQTLTSKTTSSLRRLKDAIVGPGPYDPERVRNGLSQLSKSILEK